jgi:tripartite-type tricarboxylate transporter receptor subunit TctC
MLVFVDLLPLAVKRPRKKEELTMRSKKWLLGFFVTVIFLSYALNAVYAADWPKRPLTVNVHANAGGGTDMIIRLVMSFVESEIGQKIIIVNKPGAGGEVCFSLIPGSPTDGYTWFSTYSPGMQGFSIMRKTKYKLEDFEPCAALVTDPGVLVVKADSQFKDLKQYVAHAKKNPNVLTLGNTGIGSDDFIAARLLEMGADIKVKHVAFNGAAPNRTAVLGGHIASAMINAGESKPYVVSGRLRVLAIMSEERHELLPDVPTFREFEYDVVSSSTRGFGAPAGTSMEIVTKMSAAVEKVYANPKFIEKAKKAYQPIRYKGPKEFKDFIYTVDKKLKAMYAENPW